MRKLIALLTIFSFNAYAVAPTGIGGEQGQLSYTNNLKAPNYQITSLGGVNSRIESGNTNLLMNPSFEHSSVTTGWTATGISAATAEASIVVEGKQSLKLVLNSTLSAYQDSTVNAAQLVGLQGVASIKVKTSDVSGLKACVRNAGVTSSTLCVNIPSDGTWKHVSIPFIMTATSNGIALTSTGTTGTVYIDDAFVGTSAPFQDVRGAQLVGTLTWAASTSCVWSITGTAWADPAANASCPTPTAYGAVSAPATKTPRIVLQSAPAGDYFFVAQGQFFKNSTAQQVNRFSDGTLNSNPSTMGSTASASFPNITGMITRTTSTTNWEVKVQMANIGGATSSIELDTPASFEDFQIQVYYYPPATKIYSQASQDYDWTAYTPTSPNNSFGSLSSTSCFHKRKGSDLYVSCKFLPAARNPSEAQISLPNGLVASSTIASIRNVGTYTLNATDTGGAQPVLLENGVSYFTFGYATAGSLTKRLASNLGSSTDLVTIQAGPIPISGWSDYGVIVGSFAGLEKCANDYECTDTFSAQISSTGVVSNENVDWINGNCAVTLTSFYTCNYNSNLKDGTSALTSPLNCTITPTSAAYQVSNEGLTSTTQRTFELRNQLGNLAAASSTIKCQKGSQDYKAKTAKVASSIGVPTVPGITTQAIDTFSVSYGTTNATTVCSASPCSYLDQIGSAVTSVTRASAGSYTLNTGKTYTKLKCSGNSFGSSDTAVRGPIACSNCSSVSFSTITFANSFQDSVGTLYCQGSY